ncbi:hypothetical protein QJS10_CPB04g01536 [Acorus calamus]|uniref:DUF868 family protein n=1 Tax=Acorus calamus TaxID=4465 RepID=A0AAV9EZM5_ACOCL|nr:hypothetical protein QJS10_CPB04g01536 [Acorus calamus]
MQDPFYCFSGGTSSEDLTDPSTPAATQSGQSIAVSVYRTKMSGRSRLITVTWCKDLLIHGLTVSVDDSCFSSSSSSVSPNNNNNNQCKVELRPWYFWRRQGSKRLDDIGSSSPIDVFWDLRTAKFSAGEPEPRSGYYVAVVSGDEVVLLLGDQKKEAYRKTGARPSLDSARAVSRKEHVFGKRRFATRASFFGERRAHEISIECEQAREGGTGGGGDPEMVVRVDGAVSVRVKHLQWKFRGNECISVNKARVEVYWDVHDWLFCPGLRHALFIFKPAVSSAVVAAAAAADTMSSDCSMVAAGVSEFCLFLYAWRLD